MGMSFNIIAKLRNKLHSSADDAKRLDFEAIFAVETDVDVILANRVRVRW